MRSSLLSRVVLPALFSVSLATPALGAGGVSLRWDNCLNDGGTINRDFACNANTGMNVLIASFMLDTDMGYPDRIRSEIDIVAAAGALPSWWAFLEPGSCRQASLVANNLPPTEYNNCYAWGEGGVAGTISTDVPGVLGPNSARISTTSSMPGAVPLIDFIAGFEYFFVRVSFNNAKTVGTGACGGCDVPMCIALQWVEVRYFLPESIRLISGPLNGTNSHYVTWQGGGNPTTPKGTGCPAATPTRRQTWGAVKALYR